MLFHSDESKFLWSFCSTLHQSNVFTWLRNKFCFLSGPSVYFLAGVTVVEIFDDAFKHLQNIMVTNAVTSLYFDYELFKSERFPVSKKKSFFIKFKCEERV